MSKKKKVLSANSGKKKPVKKASPSGGKKATKPSGKKNAAKKPAKPAKAKKQEKKPLKKISPKAAKPVKKSASPKKAAAKKTIKPLKNKAVTKKTASAPKKAVSVKKATPAKKVSAKASTTQKGAKKVESKIAPKLSKVPVSKKQEPKKVAEKPVKPIAPAPLPKKESTPSVEKVKKAEEVITKKQLAEKKSQEVLAITNTIPVKEKNEISLSKIASISHSITNPIKKTDSYAVKPEKEPNGKFELEFVVHSSAEMLYEFLSTPSGLSEWFCDDLNIRNGIYTFIWDDQLQQARLLKTVELQLVRFQWVDKTDGSYFEFRIQRDDLTNDISLIITDFAESVGDRESSKLLWHSQIEKLMHVIGSIF